MQQRANTWYAAALGGFLILAGAGTANALQFLQAPEISKNTNPKVPLAAILTFAIDTAVATRVDVDDGTRKWTISLPTAPAGKVQYPIVGMKPGRTHWFSVTVKDAQGVTLNAPAPLSLRTPDLPFNAYDFPTLKVHRADVSLMEPGITLLTVRRRAMGRPHTLTPKQARFGTDWGMILAVDELGEVVWYYQNDSRISGVATLRNGNIFFHTAANSPIEIDVLGNKVRQWGAALGPKAMPKGATPVQAVTLHHQPDELPNGNFLSLAAYAKSIDNYYTSSDDVNALRKTQKVMGDEIIEFTPEGHVVWRWNSFEYLDPFKIGYETITSYWWVRGFPDTVDWTHGNGVHYDERDDSILFSSRNLDAILKIDRKSKDIKWILARDVGWTPALRKKLLKPVGADFQYPSHQHNPRITPDGNIVVFNNNVFQAIPFTEDKVKPASESFSNAIVYDIDEKKMAAMVRFATPLGEKDACNAWAMGDAHVLPKTGNVLVDFSLCYPGHKIETFLTMERGKTHPDDLPSSPRIREYRQDDSARPVFEMELIPQFDLMQWEVFGVHRISSFYRQTPEKK